MDATLVVQGFEKPMSTLGGSVFKSFAHYLGLKILGSNNADSVKASAIDCIGGKIFLNLSNIFSKIPVNTFQPLLANINKQTSEIVGKYGEQYKNENVCYEIDVSKVGMAWRLPIKRFIFYNYYAQSTKENFEYYFNEFQKNTEQTIENNLNSNVSIMTIFETILDEFTNNLRDYFSPMIVLAVPNGFLKLKKIFKENFKDKPELREDLNNLTKSLPFITIQMGLELYDLTKFLDKNKYKNKSQEEFYEDYLNKVFPNDFYISFKKFMKKFGFRGEGELDIKNERYNDNHRNILNQIYSSLITTTDEQNPRKEYDNCNAKRPEVFKKLCGLITSEDTKHEFEEAYHNIINYFYVRESPKYYLIFVISKMRELILERSKILLKRNLISDINDIYKLTIKSLSHILSNIEKYTKEKIEDQIKKDNEIYEKFNSWKRYPFIFDSRGRLFFPEKTISNKKNELIGDTVSFGKVRGKAKILNSVDEKEFNPGEILITKATDPGWTPLIINSGGIILEVGGALQHGALVSREFNKPCVVGIDNATKIIKDGEEVEVDAIEGVVRLLDREE